MEICQRDRGHWSEWEHNSICTIWAWTGYSIRNSSCFPHQTGTCHLLHTALQSEVAHAAYLGVSGTTESTCSNRSHCLSSIASSSHQYSPAHFPNTLESPETCSPSPPTINLSLSLVTSTSQLWFVSIPPPLFLHAITFLMSSAPSWMVLLSCSHGAPRSA